MSKTSRTKNFEMLYYTLKQEYNQLQQDNDEICKEYESTIQMLTDSIKELQNQRSSMTKKLTQVEKEKEKLQDKNREKINDIQDLNEKNEKLSQEIKNIKNKNKEKEHQIIVLENDTEHYLKLIRQNEAVIDELNYKLEEALEDNVTIQTEFEVYKQVMVEKLSRKSDELKEIKSDMFTKNLLIKKLKDKQDKIFIDSNYLDLDGKSTRKKIKNENTKTNKKRNINTYTRDNIFNITFQNDKELFNNNISIKSIKPNNVMSISEQNNLENMMSETSKKSTKIDSYKGKKKNESNSILNSYSKKMQSIETPSNIKMIKPSSNDYSYYSYKKNFDDGNEFQEINKFELTNIDCNDTTSGLNVLQNENDELFNQDYYGYLLPNLDTNKKLSNDCHEVKEKKIKKNKNVKSKPYKEAFVKKILNSKNINNNLEKLYYYNQKKKENKYNILNKLNGKRSLIILH